jgi:serine/threonine-protein kinase
VKPIADRSLEQSLTTQAGLIVGTPGYMAPEMVVSDTVDGRADLYALGCVGYYLLTGQQVFDGDTAMKVIAKHLQEAPIPPSERVPTVVPPRLEQVILACLAKKPEDRPPSAAELARLLAAADVEPWSSEQATEWWASARASITAPQGSTDRTMTSA